MRDRFALAVALALLLPVYGCSRQPKTAPQAAPPAGAPAVAETVAMPQAPSPQPLPALSRPIAADAGGEAAAAQLSTELRRYVAYSHNIPKSFEEFIARDPVSFPPPPPGKKYVISGGRVMLK